MDRTVFLTGLLSSIVLVLGSAWPDRSKHKKWIFFIGNFGMLAYAILAYFNGNPVFYIFLECLCALSSVLAVTKVKEDISSKFLLAAGALLLGWSLYLFENTNTIFFVLGLTALAVGFVSKSAKRRNLLFVLGCILIASFSYLENSWIFFWLNAVFGLFSAYYFYKALSKRSKK
jgi:uncharacterized membrane protein